MINVISCGVVELKNDGVGIRTKKNCYLSQTATFINLKSNTMKNTMQMYYVLCCKT